MKISVRIPSLLLQQTGLLLRLVDFTNPVIINLKLCLLHLSTNLKYL